MLRNTKQEILKQISFRRMDDDRKENTGMLINFNVGKFILIRKYRVPGLENREYGRGDPLR
jgi:hypothetical protein